jgi:3-oxoadipate enol-lactonase
VPSANLVSSLDDGPSEDAPVVVLGNPIGTTRAVWDHQVPVLARHFRVVRLEWRGHGAPGAQSAAPRGPYTIAELGADVLTAVNHYGFTSFAYAGVSLGGMVGIWLAANAPERVASLAVCCSALTPMPSADLWHERARLVREGGMDAIADTVVPRWFTPSFVARHPDEVATVLAMLRGAAPEGYAGCAEAIASMDLRPLLPSVKAPTLVLSGAEDPAAPPWVGAATARGIAGSRFTVVRGTSHFAHYETPGPVTDALLRHFLATGAEL